MSGAGNPFVALVDTTGSGTSLAVFFEVGEAVSDGTQQGGGLSQNLFLAAGNYVVTASIATQEHGFGTSWPGSLFSVLVDGVSLGSVDLGPFPALGATIRGTLNVSVIIALSGSHQFQFQITTPHRVSASITPSQFIDNIAITSVPEPTGVAMVSIGFIGLFLWGLRRRPYGFR